MQVLAGACALLTPVGVAAQTENVAVPEPKFVVESAPHEPRVSLRLQKMPLAQMLGLLGAQTGVRFRLAAIPDAEATLDLTEAPLHSALRDVMATLGFTIGHDSARTSSVGESSSFWLQREISESGPNPVVMQPTTMWQIWNGSVPPHARWMMPPSPRLVEFSGTMGRDGTTLNPKSPASGVPGVAPVGVQVQWHDSTRKREESSWSATEINFNDNSLPGAQLNWKSNATSKTTTPRLRWPMVLRQVPKRVQLNIETDRPATLWINGARVLRGWTGVRRLELSQSLQVGLNLLAIEWQPMVPRANAQDADAQNAATQNSEAAKLEASEATTKVTAQSTSDAPLFRYEWAVGE